MDRRLVIGSMTVCRCRRAVAAAALIAAIVRSGPAAAQHHHAGDGPGEGDTDAVEGGAGVGLEMGEVEAFGEVRSYQGLALMAGARWRAVELSAHLPLYRIELGPESHAGLGDVHVEAAWIALPRPIEAGVSAGVMPPIGGDEYGLAMGHWMVMAGAFARGRYGRAGGAATLGYGGALEGEGHAAHGVPAWPPVAPMNSHELRATIQAEVALWRALGVTASATAAAPLGEGDFLAIAGGGPTVAIGRAALALEASHGLAGHTAGLVLATHLTVPL